MGLSLAPCADSLLIPLAPYFDPLAPGPHVYLYVPLDTVPVAFSGFRLVAHAAADGVTLLHEDFAVPIGAGRRGRTAVN